MATIKWSSNASGDWSVGSNWSSGTVPTGADGVVFDDSGADFATITLTTAQSARSVTLNTPSGDATLQLNSGGLLTLGTAQTFTLDEGIVQFNNGGELKSGTFVDAGGQVQFNGGVLSGVTWQGLLDLSAANSNLGVTNGLTVVQSNGAGPGTIDLTGSNASITLSDNETLNNLLLNFGASGFAVTINAQQVTGQSLTFGSAAVVDSDGNAFINYATLVNDGKISIANSGTLSFQSFGANQSFINAGTIAINDGTLVLAGNETVGHLGVITSTGGALFLTGTLDNTGATINVASGGEFGKTTLEGVLKGGTVVDSSGSFILAGGTLDGVLWKGTFDLATVPNQTAYIKDGFTVETLAGGSPGVITLGSNSSINLRDNETLGQVGIALGGVGSSANISLGNFQGTLAATTTVNVAGLNNFSLINQGTLTNAGTINVANSASLSVTTVSTTNSGRVNVTGGSSLSIGSNGGSFANTGVIALGDSTNTLTLAANETVAQLGSISSTGALVNITGTLDNTGNTLTLDTGLPLSNLQLSQAGTIKGGTVDDKNATVVFNGGTLSGVSWKGVLDLSVVNPNVFAGRLNIVNGLTVTAQGGGAGVIDITGQSSNLTFQDAETLSGVTVNLGVLSSSGGSTTLSGSGGGALTLDKSDTVVVNTVSFGTATLTGSTVTNKGTINNTGGNFNISGAQFNNAGTVTDSAGNSTLTVSATTFNNGSVVSAIDGAKLLIASTNVSNTGTLNVDGSSTIEFGNAISNAGNLHFLASGGLIKLDQLTNFKATVTGWAAGDQFQFVPAGTYTLGASSTDSKLVVDRNGGAVATLNIGPGYSLSEFSFSGNTLNTTAVICYARGTRIATPDGEVAVEDLREDDTVLLAPGGSERVVWVGSRRVDCARHPAPRTVWPVRVRAGAFGPGLPRRDLVLSPYHSVYVDDDNGNGILIPVQFLVNGYNIVQEQWAEVEYFHVELPRHAVLLAEGLPAESYLDTGDRGFFDNADGRAMLRPVMQLPDFASRVWDAEGCAPLVIYGAALDTVRARLASMAADRLQDAA